MGKKKKQKYAVVSGLKITAAKQLEDITQKLREIKNCNIKFKKIIQNFMTIYSVNTIK